MTVNSGNTSVDALAAGVRWTSDNITYLLDNSGISWNSVEIESIEAAFAAWEAVANLNFVVASSQTSADLVEKNYSDPGNPGSLGEHQTWLNFGNGVISLPTSGQLEGSYNRAGMGWDELSPSGGLQVGGGAFGTIVHELGHALGLDHTHESSIPSIGLTDDAWFPGIDGRPFTDTGDHNLNQDVFSVMSYVDGVVSKGFTGISLQDAYGFVGGPMAFDIAAIQFLYGANIVTNIDNDTYVLPDVNTAGTYFKSICDTGVVDQIVCNGSNYATIDLRSATLSNELGGGGFLSQVDGIYGGFAIASDFTNALTDLGSEVGVIIENAVGGSGDDTIIGNDVGNVLVGNDGNDILFGEGGWDWFRGGRGGDELHGGDAVDTADYRGAAGRIVANLETCGTVGDASGDSYDSIERIFGTAHNDVITGDGGNNTLWGEDSYDILYGGDGHDVLYGGDGWDWLTGGSGSDALIGGNGVDTAYYSQSLSGVALSLVTGGTVGDAAGDSFNSIERVQDSDYNDVLSGDDLGNTLWGGLGDDTLNGGGGADRLYGGQGSDTFEFGSNWGADVIYDFVDGSDLLDMLNAVITADDMNIESNNNYTYVSFDGSTDSITIVGVVTGINHSDFLFLTRNVCRVAGRKYGFNH